MSTGGGNASSAKALDLSLLHGVFHQTPKLYIFVITENSVENKRRARLGHVVGDQVVQFSNFKHDRTHKSLCKESSSVPLVSK